MSDNSYQKYLKYKNKYLRLKAEIESKGGMFATATNFAGNVTSFAGDVGRRVLENAPSLLSNLGESVQNNPVALAAAGGVSALTAVALYEYNQQAQRIDELEQQIEDLENSGSQKDDKIDDLKKQLDALNKAPAQKLTPGQLKEIQDTVKAKVTKITIAIKANFDIKFEGRKESDKDKYFIDLINELMKDDNEKIFNQNLDKTEFTLIPGSSEKGIDKSMEVKLILGFFKRIILDLKDNRLDYSELKNIKESAEGILDMVKVMKPGDNVNVKQIKEQNEKMKFAINRLANHLQTYTDKPRGGILFPTNFYQY